VHAVDWPDPDGACFVLAKLSQGLRRRKVVWADSAYRRNGLPEWVRSTFGSMLPTVPRPVAARGWVLVPKRWIRARTCAWIGRCRRRRKDDERTTASSEAMISIRMIHLMSGRLAYTRIRNRQTCSEVAFVSVQR
jgi:putative transposase